MEHLFGESSVAKLAFGKQIRRLNETGKRRARPKKDVRYTPCYGSKILLKLSQSFQFTPLNIPVTSDLRGEAKSSRSLILEPCS